jgi:hypothetical protein
MPKLNSSNLNGLDRISKKLVGQFQESPIKTKNKIKIRQKSKDGGLKKLTMKFLRFIRSSGQTVIDLKDVEYTLKVRKRRIYDITNVIEGKKTVLIIFPSGGNAFFKLIMAIKVFRTGFHT